MPICEYTDCTLWEPGMEECDDCIDGRYIGAVCEYASTCDECGELTSHVEMTMDEITQLGYCEDCA